MTDLQPVILIGAARSGTKFFRDLLGASQQVAVVPYDVNYIWRHGNENAPDDELTPADLTPRRIEHIRTEIERLAIRESGRRPIMVEKTVSNALRVDFVRAVFPEAKVIYLERDGLDTTESTYRQWTAPQDRAYLLKKLRYFPLREWRYAIWFAKNVVRSRTSETPAVWGVRYKGLEDHLASGKVAHVCAYQWRRSVEGWRTRQHESSEMELECSYEGLFESPSIEIERICQFIGIGDVHNVTEHFERNARPVSGTWPGSIPSEDEASTRAIIEGVGGR